MVSRSLFALSAFALVTSALTSESDQRQAKGSQEQGQKCMVQPEDLSLLQTSSYHTTVIKREGSTKEGEEAEAQMALAEIRDELRRHPKVAKKALHEALLEMRQSSWPWSTGANEISSLQSQVATAPSQAAPQAVKVPSLPAGFAQSSTRLATRSNWTLGHQQPREQVGQVLPNALPTSHPAQISAVEQPDAEAIAPTISPARVEEAVEPTMPPAPGVKIAPFGKEDTAHELQKHAQDTQDTLVDAVENAEVAEVKRSVFRALTRLRAASIKEFDTIARLETQAFDEYNDAHHYRAENPLDYLHSNEPKVKEDKFTSFH